LLALVLVAMPLKYGLDLPLAVRIAGSVHGILFLVLIVALLRSLWEAGLPRKAALQVLVLAVLPFGFLAADRIVRRAIEAEPA